MDGAGFHERIFLARSSWEIKHRRRLNQTGLAKRVGELRGEPVAQTTISDWFNKVVPDLHDVEYLAKALECDPGWLAFGPASEAPGPDDPTIKAHESIRPPKRP